jgi:hypothetical protein
MNDGTNIALPRNPRLSSPYSHWGTAKPDTTPDYGVICVKGLRWAAKDRPGLARAGVREALGRGAVGGVCSGDGGGGGTS